MKLIKTTKNWQKYIHDWAKRKGWWENENRNKLEIAALLHTEISEFVEELREGYKVNEYRIEEGKPCGACIELADLAIRLYDCCEAWGIDLNEMIRIKMIFNETRPYRHGNKTA